MSDQIVDVRSEEYRKRFIDHLDTVYGIDGEMAACELEANIDGFDEGEESIPEWDADECISYWGP